MLPGVLAQQQPCLECTHCALEYVAYTIDAENDAISSILYKTSDIELTESQLEAFCQRCIAVGSDLTMFPMQHRECKLSELCQLRKLLLQPLLLTQFATLCHLQPCETTQSSAPVEALADMSVRSLERRCKSARTRIPRRSYRGGTGVGTHRHPDH